jgi:hypothetical protein
MEVLKSLVASITQNFTEFKEVYVGTFEQLKVMLPSFTYQDIENLFALLVNNDLRLQRMSLFLT